MKFTESVNVRDTTSDESDQESIDSNFTNHNLENSNEEDVNIISANDMKIPSENGTQEESEDYSYEENSVEDEEDDSDDTNVDDNISDEEDRSEEDSDDNDENEGMHANLLAEEQDDVEALREWAIDGNVSRILVTKLLAILRRRAMPNLPKTADTLLKNRGNFEIVTVENSFQKTAQYVYFGIAKGLVNCVNPILHPGGVIDLIFHVDGVSLFQSSRNQFWPILCRVHCNERNIYSPFPIALYMGSQKPENLNLFFARFIAEMNELKENGIRIGGDLFQLRIKCFIADTPARALIKCTVGHTGFYSCERCEIQGKKYNHVSCFAKWNEPERTNDSFRNQTQPMHHTNISPLLEIREIDMVKMFLLDYMHLAPLGIMKKLITILLQEFDNHQLQQFDFILETIKAQIPSDFQRKTQSIKEIRHWKATQYSFFLLYAGIVVFKFLLPENLYKHFSLLFTGFRILCSPELSITYHCHAK